MTKYKISFHSPDEDIKGEKKKLDIYQNESNEDIKLSPSLEIQSKDVIQKPKAKDTVKPKNKIMAPKKNINDQPKNKIELPKFKPNYTPKNKIEPKKLKPDYKPINKIEKAHLPPNYQPTYKITLKKLEPNYTPKNKIAQIPNKSKIEEIKKQIENIEWEKISDNWVIRTRANQYSDYKEIILNPSQECSQNNPLYRHKEWLERIYNDQNFKLNDKKLAHICNVDSTVIGKWRKIHNIPTKQWGEGRYINKRNDRSDVYVRTPKNYKHPKLTNFNGYRLEHIYKMERFLSKHPELEISKKCLIDGKYLKKGVEVHHINQNSKDNRIENLWVYACKKDHALGEKSLYNALKDLLRTNQIEFKNGKYSINHHFDDLNKNFSTSKYVQLNNYKDIDFIRKEIKTINWEEISNNWTVEIKKNQFTQKTIKIDPYKNCSESNPLYRHKIWLETIVKNENFNLTDSRLGELCGISKDKARYWRDKVHKIEGKKEWGYKRIIDKSDGRIWIRVPKDYENPVVNKKEHHRRFMLEHRYIMEKYLTEHTELESSKKFLMDGKFLKPETEVHHINLDFQDNRKENLWVCENGEEHKVINKSLYNLVENLLNYKLLTFKNGKYY